MAPSTEEESPSPIEMELETVSPQPSVVVEGSRKSKRSASRRGGGKDNNTSTMAVSTGGKRRPGRHLGSKNRRDSGGPRIVARKRRKTVRLSRYKQYHDVEDIVYANRSQEKDGQWCRGQVVDYEFVCNGTFGDVRTYTIYFDDGVEMDGIHEFFVDTAEDYEWMESNDADDIKGVTQVTCNSSTDRYMRERGYYEVELGRDLVYRSLVRAMRAYDRLIVQQHGTKVTPNELNLPDEWDFGGSSVPQRKDVLSLSLQKVRVEARGDDDSQVTMTDVSSVDSSKENNTGRDKNGSSCPVDTSKLSPELMELAEVCATNAANQSNASTSEDGYSSKAPKVDWTVIYDNSSQTLRTYMDSKATEAGYRESEDKKSRLVPQNIMKGYDEYFGFLYNQLLKTRNKEEIADADDDDSVSGENGVHGDCPVDISLFSHELHELAYLLSFYDPNKKCNQYNSYWPEVVSKASKRLRRLMDSVEGFHESRRKRLLLVPPKLHSTFSAYHRYLYKQRCAGELEEKDFAQDHNDTETGEENEAESKAQKDNNSEESENAREAEEGENAGSIENAEEGGTLDRAGDGCGKRDAEVKMGVPRDDNDCPVDLSDFTTELRELAQILSQRHPHQKGGSSLWRKARYIGSARLNRYLDSLDGFDQAVRKFSVAVPAPLRDKFIAYRLYLYEKRVAAEEDEAEDESDCPIDKEKFSEVPELLEIARLAKSFPYSKGTPVRNLWRHVHARASPRLRAFLDSKATPEGFLKMRSKQQRLVPAELMDDFVTYRRYLHRKYCEKSAAKVTANEDTPMGDADENRDKKRAPPVDEPKGDGDEADDEGTDDEGTGDEGSEDAGTGCEEGEASQLEGEDNLDEENTDAEEDEESKENEESKEDDSGEDSVSIADDERCPDTSRLSPELIELARLLSKRDPSVVYNKENSIWPLVFKKASPRLRRHMDSIENFSSAKCKENALVPATLRAPYVAYRTYLQAKRFGHTSEKAQGRKPVRQSTKPNLRSHETDVAHGGGAGSEDISDEESACGGCPVDTSQLTVEMLEIAELCSLRDPQVCGSNKRTFWTDVYNMASPRVQKYMKGVKGFSSSHKKRDLLVPANCRGAYVAYLNYLVKKRKAEFTQDTKAKPKHKKCLGKPKKSPVVPEPKKSAPLPEPKRKRARLPDRVDEASPPEQQKMTQPKFSEPEKGRKRSRTEGKPAIGKEAPILVNETPGEGPQTQVEEWHLKYKRRSRAFEDSADQRWQSFCRIVRRQWSEVSGLDPEKLAKGWENFQQHHRSTWQDFLNGEAQEVLHDCELALRSAQRNLLFDEGSHTDSQLYRYMKMLDRYMDRRKHRLEATLDWLHAQIQWFLGRHMSVQLVQWHEFWEEINEHADEFRCLGRVALERHLEECGKAVGLST